MAALVLRALVSVAICVLAYGVASAQPLPGGLKIVVVEGEDAVNIVQQRTAVAPVVEIRDRNDLPIAGVPVTFTISGGNALFGGGLQTLTLTTNAAGRAAVAGLTPTSSGAIQIQVSAAFQGQTATATIAQTNVMTAAQAAGASGASGGTGSGAGAGGAAGGGGGGLSATTIGIVGAAVGGGALAAVKASGGDGSDGDSGGDAGPGASPVVWGIGFTPFPGLNVSACGLQTTFCAQVAVVDASGNFQDLWSPGTPVLRATGTVTPTTFSATLACVNTPATGTLSASWDGTAYVGAAMLGQASSGIRVTRGGVTGTCQ